MNAQELANYLFDITDMENSPYHKAATMLVQQQAEIEALKSERAIMFGFVKNRGEVGQLIVYKASLEAQEK